MTIEEFAERLKRMVDENNHISPIDIDIVLQGAKSERTNFEKWKEQLTIEKFAEIMDAYTDFFSCCECPIFKNGNRSNTICIGLGCVRSLTEWGNKKVNDEVKE